MQAGYGWKQPNQNDSAQFIPAQRPVVGFGADSFKRLLRQSGLKDSAQGRGVCPTWPTFNPLMLIPLDHCLYSSGIEIMARQTGPQVGSDHFPVIVDFVIREDSGQPSLQADLAE